jgi:hypothetical protein
MIALKHTIFFFFFCCTIVVVVVVVSYIDTCYHIVQQVAISIIHAIVDSIAIAGTSNVGNTTATIPNLYNSRPTGDVMVSTAKRYLRWQYWVRIAASHNKCKLRSIQYTASIVPDAFSRTGMVVRRNMNTRCLKRCTTTWTAMTLGCEVGWQWMTCAGGVVFCSTIASGTSDSPTPVSVIFKSAGTEVRFCAMVSKVELLHKAHTLGQLFVRNHCSMQTRQYRALHK